MSRKLLTLAKANHDGKALAIPSVCTAHPQALAASLILAEELDEAIVIEATSNQVNQEGGYTGLEPHDFIEFVRDIARQNRVNPDRILFGGDHLGPQAWRKEPVGLAMAKAHQMVAAYAKAGFTKFHLDCSEGCASEPAQLDDAVTANRSAELAATILEHAPDPLELVFVIGTEVPPPGGARSNDEGDIRPTEPLAAQQTLRAHADAFARHGLIHVLPQICGLVVQPGVEFSPTDVHRLPLDRDPGLRPVLKDWPNLCLEAHSTDYQHPEVFPRLAELGFGFQKIGPALTFAWREAVYALDRLSAEAGLIPQPHLPATMEHLMVQDQRYWSGHYRGDPEQLKWQRHFGLADRIRYYWPQPPARAAVDALFAGLRGNEHLLGDLTQDFLAQEVEWAKHRSGDFALNLAFAHVQSALRPYFFAKRGP